ncbi:MAG TPA: nucleoside-diphosphate kinase [Candidatus Humimicrobiaceae bacterium]
MSGCRNSKNSDILDEIDNNLERSLIIVKPDGVEKKVIGEIISRFEKEDLNIEKLKMLRIDRELAHKHYQDHKDKSFFDILIEYITSGPVVAMVISGKNAITRVRELMGPTDPRKAKRGTIRGDFGGDITVNVIHGSDSRENARREIELFFGQCE